MGTKPKICCMHPVAHADLKVSVETDGVSESFKGGAIAVSSHVSGTIAVLMTCFQGT